MRTKKTFKVVMLPTEKVSNLFLNSKEIREFKEFMSDEIINTIPLDKHLMLIENPKLYSLHAYTSQHLYIISDDEIKEGEYMYDEHPERGLEQVRKCPNNSYHGGGYWKIIATTDTLYWSDDRELQIIDTHHCKLPQLSESFIQAYIKAYNEGKPITEVDLEMEQYSCKGYCDTKKETNGSGYCEESCKGDIKTRKDNSVIIHQSKLYTRDEVERLTMEAFACGSNATDMTGGCDMGKYYEWIEKNL